MIRFGIPLIGSGVWTGGLVYLKNTINLINDRLSGSVEPVVFLSQAQADFLGDEVSQINARTVVGGNHEKPGRGGSLARALVTGIDAGIESALQQSAVDVVLESATFYGWRFPVPVIAWMPDFQHRFMPEMFSRRLWWRRDIGFRVQIASGRTIMLSSETAREDCETFYPGSKGRTCVVRFAMNMDVTAPFSRAPAIREKYGLPERFFYLPNQFWRHKNHEVVISALGRIRGADKLGGLPPIAVTGLPRDPRNPSYFEDMMKLASDLGVASHFRFLGLVPYADVMALSAGAAVQINPSRFEGWSTPIEEAKALGTPLILSDLRVHREQAPGARFFDPSSPEACASSLLEASVADVSRPSLDALAAAQDVRLNAHASALHQTLTKALASH